MGALFAQLVTGVVYAPDTIDAEGDFWSAEAVREACERWNASKADVLGGVVLDSTVVEHDSEIAGTAVKAGSWVMTLRLDAPSRWLTTGPDNPSGYSIGWGAKST